MSTGYTAYHLTPDARQQLLAQFPPRYPKVDAEHATYQFGVAENTPIPAADTLEVIGRADDGQGIEALIVRVNGKTERPGGLPFHITWSYDPAKTAPAEFDLDTPPKPQPYCSTHSNKLIASGCHSQFLPEPITAKVMPQFTLRKEAPAPATNQTGITIDNPKQPLFIMLIGVASSGKSTFANECLLPWLRDQGREVAVISKDQTRNEKTAARGISFEQFQQDKSNNLLVEKQLKDAICSAAQGNKDIIIDRVNSTAKYRKVTMENIPSHYKKIAIVFEPVKVETLFMRSLGRDAERIEKGQKPYLIPARAIKQKIDQLQLPTRAEGFDQILSASFEKDSPHLADYNRSLAR